MFFSDKIFKSLPNQKTASSASGHTGRSMTKMDSYNAQSDRGKQRSSSEERRTGFKKFVRRYES
jgi:hypothetical protein